MKNLNKCYGKSLIRLFQRISLIENEANSYLKTGNKHTQDIYQVYDVRDPLCYDYHVYALERRDGRLRFYLDGFKYWEVDMTFVSRICYNAATCYIQP